MNTIKPILTTALMFLLLTSSSYAQQWFLKTWAFAQSGETVPDYDPQGSYLTPDGAAVLLYGTVNYSEGELDNTQGGAEVLINKNDLDGDPIWSFSLGTGSDEYVSRVIEDEDGNIIVAVNQYDNGSFIGHLIKVDVNLSGSTYSFTIQEQMAKNDFKFKDLIEIFTPLSTNSRGYGFVGFDFDEQKAVVGAVDQNLDHTGSNYWIKQFEGTSGADNVELLSLIQATSTVEEPGSIVNTVYLNTLVVCGSSESPTFYGGRSAYLAKIGLYNASVYDDLQTGYGSSSCELFYNHGYQPRVFSEVIQAEDGGYVCLTQSVESDVEGDGFNQYAANITRISSNLDEILWNSRALMDINDPNNVFCQLDVVETELFYTVVMTNPDNSNSAYYLVANFLKDGTFNGHAYISDPMNANAGITSSVEQYDENKVGQQFVKDFALSCGDQLHFPGAAVGAVPSGWSAANYTNKGVTHVKQTVGDLDALCLKNEFSVNTLFCDEITFLEGYEMNTALWGELTNDVSPYEPEYFIAEAHDASFYEHCASNCESYTCGPTVTTIYVCEEDLTSKGTVLAIPAVSDVKDVLWNDGTMSEAATGFGLSVFSIGIYDARVRTIGGCVLYYEYIVLEHPETNLEAIVTGLTCHDGDDAEICFTSDVSIASAFIEYTYNNTAYAPTSVTIGSSSFCFSDLIASIHGPINGLETGYYEINVTDVNGCTDAYSVTIENPDELIVSASFGCGSVGIGDEFLEIDIQGGALPYFFSIYRTAGVGTLQSVPSDQWPNSWINDPSTELPLLASSGIDREYSPGVLWEYIVNVFDANGCQVSISGLYVPICPFPNDPLGIAENADGSIALSVYPNPTSNFATVNADVASDFTLYSNTGQVVMTGELVEGETQLDVASLPAGLYLLRSNGMTVNLVVE